MIGAFTNHLWQSTLFVLAAALVAAALRQNGAHIRHRIWLLASLKLPRKLALCRIASLLVGGHAGSSCESDRAPQVSRTRAGV